MISRLMFLIHWATLLWVGGCAIDLFVHIAEYGFQSFGASLIEVLAIVLGPSAVFYLIDYIINGKIIWLPWEREK